jgi:uncharacterized protein
MRKVIMAVLFMGLMGTAAFAQSYDIKEMTPAVTSALEGRKARFLEIKALKADGIVGETNQGYVEALEGDEATAELVAMENKDRRAIYEAIVTQNDLGVSALATVEGVFAKVQRYKANVGEKVQDESGEWISK